MKFVLEFKCDGPDFVLKTMKALDTISNILQEVAKKVENGIYDDNIVNTKGNVIGKFLMDEAEANLYPFSEQRKKDDLNFLSDTRKWPRSELGGYVCLRKKDNECAFILQCDNPDHPLWRTPLDAYHPNGHEVTISLGNIFDGGTGELEKYESLESLLNSGWYVD